MRIVYGLHRLIGAMRMQRLSRLIQLLSGFLAIQIHGKYLQSNIRFHTQCVEYYINPFQLCRSSVSRPIIRPAVAEFSYSGWFYVVE